MSLLPAIIAIVIAFALRNVIVALLLGLWVGASLLRGGSFADFGMGILDALNVHVVAAIADSDHAAVITFTLMMGGLVGIIIRNGGMHCVLQRVLAVASSRRGAQLSVSSMGLLIFFDDYANTMVVGNTARTLTDHLKISRQKLAYIVDSTAAPIAALAILTTWIGFEVSLIDDAIAKIDGLADMSAYSLFLQSIPYSFYPILAVSFVVMIAASGRDFGPMLAAEQRAADGVPPAEAGGSGEVLVPKEAIQGGAWLALVPIMAMLFTLVAGLFATGEGDTLATIIGSADGYKAMVWASMVGVVVAAVLTLLRGELGLEETVDAWYVGARSVLFGIFVLVMAWALSSVTIELGASAFLVTTLQDGISPYWLPAVVFVLAALTAFATGTCWGTMAVLTPLAIPLCWALLQAQGISGDLTLLYSVIACVLSGAVWGDHCSPISDTTVLSSLASGCDLVEHVRTQLPYAMTAGAAALLLGIIPSAFGLSPLLCLLVALVVLAAVIAVLGRDPGKAPEPASTAAES